MSSYIPVHGCWGPRCVDSSDNIAGPKGVLELLITLSQWTAYAESAFDQDVCANAAQSGSHTVL